MPNSIKQILDKNLQLYNSQEFIKSDPIQIPHRFTKKEDIEIAAFLTSIIAWGNRKMIINNAVRLMNLMKNAPFDFVINSVPDYKNFDGENPENLSQNSDWQAIKTFVHRTFNGYDCMIFLLSVKRIYVEFGGLEKVFTDGFNIDKTIFSALKYFREIFLQMPHNKRVERNLSDVQKNSAAKRLNMFLRWLVRQDENGVDFGLWHGIPTSALMLPLDIHAGNTSRQLGILYRTQNDWKAVEEVTAVLRGFCPDDPIKYDFALFGAGVFKEKKHTDNTDNKIELGI
ncbi:MAG: TIGR02757 family protein [Prevotellaceae bacterium]|jgi:uncharacterized protein (TIGR02757 family)|nr:TIGR02757 family protein [Prevotellaceae bacterium]